MEGRPRPYSDEEHYYADSVPLSAEPISYMKHDAKRHKKLRRKGKKAVKRLMEDPEAREKVKEYVKEHPKAQEKIKEELKEHPKVAKKIKEVVEEKEHPRPYYPA